MSDTELRAPFVWFGGKRRVAAEVWAALGDVDSYVEPFAGSLAVLLGRPLREGERRCETINDKDAFVANFWRALAADPDAVALHADWPVNETDLFARHLWLVNSGVERLAQLEADPEFYDAKVAGWWVWGINAWIGSGWCSGAGPWKLAAEDAGVNRQLPHLGDAGQGVNRKLPHLGDAGRGVNRKLPNDIPADYAPSSCHVPTNWTPGRVWQMRELAERLRNVRVCAGDWSRVVTMGALHFGATVGVFLDPPYSGEVRCSGIYRAEDYTVSAAVREWCLANGDDPRLRIVLAGYTDEHDTLLPDTWRRHHWKAGAAYQRAAGGGQNAENRHKECLWLSPHCLRPAASPQQTLFDE